MTAWISRRDAAALLGVTRSAIGLMIKNGRLVPGPKVGGRGTVDAAQVDELRYGRYPDREHEWLSVAEAAQLAGVTRQAVNKQCQRERLPSVLHGGRRWLRRDQLEMVLRSRASTGCADASIDPAR